MDNNGVKYNSRSNMAERSFSMNMVFRNVYTVTLTLEIQKHVLLLAKAMTYPKAMDNNCVKCYSDPLPTWRAAVMARTRILGMCAL